MPMRYCLLQGNNLNYNRTTDGAYIYDRTSKEPICADSISALMTTFKAQNPDIVLPINLPNDEMRRLIINSLENARRGASPQQITQIINTIIALQTPSVGGRKTYKRKQKKNKTRRQR